ncbi:hypothetical protein [Dethiobacter alkaliphilus]|nr:hypothetical protein [Dethiobacter alkaliphilus]
MKKQGAASRSLLKLTLLQAVWYNPKRLRQWQVFPQKEDYINGKKG